MTDKASFLAVTDSQGTRIADSVRFTEMYGERLKALLDAPLPGISYRQPKPLRGILLQNVYGGLDGAMQLIGRDSDRSYNAYYVTLVGQNDFPTSGNTFTLSLQGGTIQDDGTISYVDIGTTAPINCVTNSVDFQTAVEAIDPGLLGTTDVGLGNPFSAPELQVYGDVVAPDPADPTSLPKSYLGMWYINFRSQLTFDRLLLKLGQQISSSLVNTIVTPTFDTLVDDIEIATDMSYRTQDFPWQVGTMATIFDYADIGFGILTATGRTFDVDQ